MSITSRTIETYGNRCRAAYNFSDNRTERRGPFNVSGNSDAETKALAMESDVLSSVQMRDAKEAVRLNIISDYKEATEVQVKYQYINIGYNQEETWQQYDIMKDIAPELISMNLTTAEYAFVFNATEEEVKNAILRWEYLEANKDVLIAYKSVVEGLV